MYSFKSLHDIDLSYKRVLLRVALDVPLKDGRVAEDFRIREILPTLAYLLKKNCSVVILTWLGRPDGKVVAKYRLDPVAKRLEQLIRRPVRKVNDAVGRAAKKAIFDLQPGQILMLENIRFYPGEMAAEQGLAAELADGFDYEVFDGFAQSHRVHASTTGLLNELPAVAGYSLEKELSALGGVLDQSARPLVLLIGGAKASDKIELISHLLARADKVLVGGAVATVFLKARGEAVGKSFLSDVFVNQAKAGARKDYFKLAKELLEKYHHKIILPEDLVAAAGPESRQTKIIDLEQADLPKNWGFYDIGPKTVKLYAKQFSRAGTILWNGPMGKYETRQFSAGTRQLASAVAGSSAVTLAGGGDTETVIQEEKLVGKFSHVSTGGGAMLEFLSGRRLPALEALSENQKNHKLWTASPRAAVDFTKENNPYWRVDFVNLRQILGPAIKQKFGVPALNVRSPYILDAILGAAFAERSPVIVEIAESEIGYTGISPERLVKLIVERLPKLEKKYGYKIPVALHLDHLKHDLSLATRAVKAGFSSLAIDQSEYPLPQNIKTTRAMVKRVHSLGVSVEGEIGEIGQAQASQMPGITLKKLLKFVPTVSEAVEFVAETGVDVFAGFFGNYHGRYNGPATITWGRMKEISRAFQKRGWAVPLALHGSSYINTKEFNRVKICQQALNCGCRKFNHATALSDILRDNLPRALVQAMIKAGGSQPADWRKALGKFELQISRLDKKILDRATAKIQEHIQMMMREAWRSAGKGKNY
ncbi:MAG: phosphoglycerate kinase [Patescibacteria group bacterium]|jgi:phosphoglycerate kinase